MSRTAIYTFGTAALLSAVLLLAYSPRTGEAKDEDVAERAKAVWHGTCQRCHTVPDATYETGRAFLAQITETS